MAIILNIETATTVCSVALAKDGKLIAIEEQNGDYSHAENLTVFIENALQKAKFKLTAIDAIAVSKGPGSYTGLRIGVSVAKGLCYALDKPLIAIDTLQHLALSVSCIETTTNENNLYCPMIDARRMEVYCAIFDKCNTTISATEAKIISENSFESLLKNNKIFFFGDGSSKCKSYFSNSKNACFIDSIVPSAKAMISLSELSYNKSIFENVAYFEPYYLKDFVTIASKKNNDEKN